MGAVSSYMPAGVPTEVPPRDRQEKTLWQVGDAVQCINCSKPIYEVIKEIKTTLALANLRGCLTPYSANVPLLRGDEVIHTQPLAFNCPLCGGEGSVLIW